MRVEQIGDAHGKCRRIGGIRHKNPFTRGKVLPASKLCGDRVLATADQEAALREYETALSRSANRFHSLYGAGRATELNND